VCFIPAPQTSNDVDDCPKNLDRGFRGKKMSCRHTTSQDTRALAPRDRQMI
jgi:hypothetical protein